MDNFVDLVDFFLLFSKKVTQIFTLSTKASCKLSFIVLDQSMKELQLNMEPEQGVLTRRPCKKS